MGTELPVAVVYINDRNYHEITMFSAASLCHFHKSPLDIHLFQVGYSQEPPEELRAYAASRGIRLITLPMSPEEAQLPSASLGNLHGHISSVTLLKAAAIERIAADHERIVYLDGDVLACREIDFAAAFAFTTSMAGVHDFVSYMPYDGQDLIGHATATGRSPDYFNAGLILISGPRWKDRSFGARYLAALESHATHCPWRHDEHGAYPGGCKGADQCAFNIAAEHDWTPLDFRWNAQKPVRHTPVWRDAFLRHYTGPAKFLAASPRTRDRVEHRVLRRIERETGLFSGSRRRFLAGVPFMLDNLRLRAVTRNYHKVFARLAPLAPADRQSADPA